MSLPRLEWLRRMFRLETVHAHCDVPCGIYDPHEALVAAHTCVRMTDLIAEVSKKEGGELEQRNALVRYVATKEEHAERCKHEVRVIWGDYFKEEHAKAFPELHGLVWKIMRQGSRVRQTVEGPAALDLLESVNRFAEIFWKTQQKDTHAVKAPYPTERPMTLPILK